jgi:hypothetical protein
MGVVTREWFFMTQDEAGSDATCSVNIQSGPCSETEDKLPPKERNVHKSE